MPATPRGPYLRRRAGHAPHRPRRAVPGANGAPVALQTGTDPAIDRGGAHRRHGPRKRIRPPTVRLGLRPSAIPGAAAADLRGQAEIALKPHGPTLGALPDLEAAAGPQELHVY